MESQSVACNTQARQRNGGSTRVSNRDLGLGWGIEGGFGVHFARKWLQLLGRLWGRSFYRGICNSMPCKILPLGLRAQIRHFRHHSYGGSIKTFGPPLRFRLRIVSGAQAKWEEKKTPKPTSMLHLTSPVISAANTTGSSWAVSERSARQRKSCCETLGMVFGSI